MNRMATLLVAAVAALVLSAGNVTAQVTTATLIATVNDSSGAVVPGALLTLTEERTGVARTQHANEVGFCVFQFVPIGGLHDRH